MAISRRRRRLPRGVEVCHGMLAPPITNLGVKGIRKAMKWPDVLDAEALSRTCFNVAVFIDQRGGTGGGIFRHTP